MNKPKYRQRVPELEVLLRREGPRRVRRRDLALRDAWSELAEDADPALVVHDLVDDEPAPALARVGPGQADPERVHLELVDDRRQVGVEPLPGLRVAGEGMVTTVAPRSTPKGWIW